MKLSIKFGCLCFLFVFIRVYSLGAQEFAVTGQIELLNDVTGRSSFSASNVVVWLTPIPGSASPSQTRARFSHRALRIAQKHKAFDPHVLAVEVGSAVQFPNYDPFFHNVFSLFEGKRFDLGLYEAGSSRIVVFDRPGICYLFCNIHAEMSAVVLVLNTPYFAVTDAAGQLRIAGVPPGRYELRVWYERSLPDELKSLTREVTISETARSLGTIRLREIHVQPQAHKNKYGHDYDNPTPPSSVYNQP
jgi:plastocyanin